MGPRRRHAHVMLSQLFASWVYWLPAVSCLATTSSQSASHTAKEPSMATPGPPASSSEPPSSSGLPATSAMTLGLPLDPISLRSMVQQEVRAALAGVLPPASVCYPDDGTSIRRYISPGKGATTF